MNYTLITPKGRVIAFYGLECAEIFQQAYGGVIVTAEVLELMTEKVSS